MRALYLLFGTFVFFIAFYLDEKSPYTEQISSNLNDFNLYLTLLYGFVTSFILNGLIESELKITKGQATKYVGIFLSILLVKIIYNAVR
jgi:hypothetical protein